MARYSIVKLPARQGWAVFDAVTQATVGGTRSATRREATEALSEIAAPTSVYVATLDTGGIKHSGREYIAVAATEAEAREAIYAAWLAGHPGGREGDYGYVLTSAEELGDHYGIRIQGVTFGTGTEVDY
jgi:hypothetical protein